MALVVVEHGEGQRVDVGRDAEAEDQHQECRAEHGEAEPDRIAQQLQRLADRAGEKPPQAERGRVARSRVRRRLPIVDAAARRTLGATAGSARAGRLFEIADERILERGGAARLDQPGRRVGRQHAAGIHQRNAVAALGLVHEMGRDEDRHALVARQIDQQFPEPIARQRIDARGRLVEDQHLGLVHDRDGERQPLADAERQVLRRAGRHDRQDRSGRPVRRCAPSPFAPADGTGARAGRGSAEPSARYRARTTATCSRRACARSRSLASSGRPNSSASPSLAGNSPVSIFIVVVLPQPFEPTKPKISPRSIVKLTWSTAVKSPKRQVRSRATMTGSVVDRCGAAGFAARGGRRARRSGSRAMNASSIVRAPVVCLELGRRAGRDDLAGIHRDQPVEPLGLFHVGGRDDDAHAWAARAHALDQFPELAARQRIDAGRRLVEDQQIGVVDQRAAKAELLPHAARQLLRRAVGERREPGAVEQLGDAPLAARPRDWPNRRPKNSMFSRTLRSG